MKDDITESVEPWKRGGAKLLRDIVNEIVMRRRKQEILEIMQRLDWRSKQQ